MIRAPKGREPYKGTPIGVDQSKAMITKLLREYGAEGVSWTDNFKTGQVNLRFVVTREDGRSTSFSITPAPFKEKHSTYDPVAGRQVSEELPNWPRAMRLLHGWLKTKLESIAFGLTEVEEEFLAQTVVRDKHGQETTAGELVLNAIEVGGGQLALEAPKRREGVIDTDARAA